MSASSSNSFLRNHLSSRTEDRVKQASALRFGIASYSGRFSSPTAIRYYAKYGISNFAEIPLELVDWHSFSFIHDNFPSKPTSGPNSKAFKEYRKKLSQEQARQITYHLTQRVGWLIRTIAIYAPQEEEVGICDVYCCRAAAALAAASPAATAAALKSYCCCSSAASAKEI